MRNRGVPAVVVQLNSLTIIVEFQEQRRSEASSETDLEDGAVLLSAMIYQPVKVNLLFVFKFACNSNQFKLLVNLISLQFLLQLL